MPATFVVLSPNHASGQRKQTRGRSFKLSRVASPNRQKRIQVTRACDWCRVHRIKCDNNYPCQNCHSRQGHCSRRERSKTRTLPSAVREIEKLEERIRQLEEQLQNPTKPVNDGSLVPAFLPSEQRGSKLREGVYSAGVQCAQRRQWYGLLSNFYYISRLRSHLTIALQQPQSDCNMQPKSASQVFVSPTSSKSADSSLAETALSADLGESGSYLTPTQEDYFLSLFWESYHCTFQILDEGEFREHYRSLWETSSPTRKSSALVDIILAICMQYGLAFLPREDSNSEPKAMVDGNDATIAGRWYYHRSQMLLNSQLENPTIMTVQCQILTVKYLCNASYQNMAYSGLATAVRTAHLLGMHLEPPADMPREQRELRRRVWWTLYCMECKTCMKLDRPWSAPFSLITCQLPADDRQLALISGSNFASYGENLTWLTYTQQITKMMLAVRTVFVAFADKCGDVVASNSGRGIYTDPQTLEDCAIFLGSKMEVVRSWESQVPAGMKTKRKNDGVALSTDRTMLDIELYAPLWLQRQRLMLELLYHNLLMNLHRPFICFPSTLATENDSSTPLVSPSQSVFSNATPMTESHTRLCIEHAITITRIMHQVLTGSDILSGMHEAFHFQWNATVSLIGFILAFPLSPLIPEARENIKNAITVFETFGRHFAVGASAANVTWNLVAKADYLTERFHAQLASLELQSSNTPDLLHSYLGTLTVDNMNLAGQSLDFMELMNFPMSGTTDLGFSLDPFASSEQFFSGSINPDDAWVPNQS
ncbi:conserved hypothetical protein [Talaromyces stipitatus ATCC 10500]|uniref:Zn(2)-C6 fungal-type domain-containing protein n=1 Tax=Talaromyces stipitatus (strain ATCC 10500 / CBS 375.48 / QM 6759 / NRRL 1006) TaxID=441959 RepID=B8M7Q7_TALSN|nr:uncharacterized protein TSTA_030520 [Talaromyces stipitatus ATCC 10500]EED19786.1 conserved hypothetical protein [Talaromyces stipitatus ATCC 10500]